MWGVRRDSALGGFAANVDLDQYVQLFAKCLAAASTFLPASANPQNPRRETILPLCGLVRLQMADHVPLGVVQIAQVLDLAGKLLHAVLAENALPGVVGFADRSGGCVLLTAIRVISPGLRPARRAAAVMRSWIRGNVCGLRTWKRINHQTEPSLREGRGRGAGPHEIDHTINYSIITSWPSGAPVRSDRPALDSGMKIIKAASRAITTIPLR